MIFTSSSVRPGVAVFLWLLLVTCAVAQPAPEKKTAVFKILVPADAVLEIDGFRTASMGESRRFESPPVAVGHSYSYLVKATWQGKTVRRTIEVRPDQETTLDLRDAWKEAAPAVVAKIALLLPPELTLEAGKEATLPVSLKRDDYKGAVALSAAQLPTMVTAKDEKIAAQESSGRLVLVAAPTAHTTTSEVVVIGTGEGIESRATFRLIVKAAPPPTRLLTITVPPALTVKAGQEATLPVSLKRVEVRGPVTLRTEGLPNGVTADEITAPSGIDNVQVRVFAAPTAAAATRDVVVIASSGPTSGRAPFRLTVEPRPSPKPEPPAPPSLTLAMPPTLTIEAGDTAYAEVRALLSDAATSQVEPEIALDVPAGSSLRVVSWTAFPPNGRRAGFIRGFALRATETAPEGEYDVRATARLGHEMVSDTFKVTVKKAVRPVEPKPAPAELALTVPPELTLEPGGRGYAEVRVRLRDGGELTAEPQVDLSVPADSGVRIEPWTWFPLNKKVGAVRGYSLRVDPEATEGDREVKVTARLGDAATLATFKIHVKKPAVQAPGG